MTFMTKRQDTFSSAPTHVLFLIDQLREMGGAERILLNIIRLLPREKFRCSLATFKINPGLDIFDDFPCRLHFLALRRTYDWNALKMALRIRNLIRSEQVGIVHTFFESADLWGGLVSKLSGAPALVSSRRDMGIMRSSKHDLAYRAINPLFDMVLAVSEQVRKYCIEHDRLDPKKVVTLYNGIEMGKVQAAKGANDLSDSLGLAHASHIVTTVGHIRRVKGVDIFLRAAATVCNEFPQAMFLVAGDVIEPDYFRELKNLAASLNLTRNVKFMGNVENVFSVLKSSDVFCLLSRSEGFSNALVEAMACGLPCIATRVGGNAEAVEEGASGFLVASEDPDAAADRVLRLLRNPGRAKQSGEAARKIVEARFTTEAMIAKLVNLYDTLLAAKRG